MTSSQAAPDSLKICKYPQIKQLMFSWERFFSCLFQWLPMFPTAHGASMLDFSWRSSCPRWNKGQGSDVLKVHWAIQLGYSAPSLPAYHEDWLEHLRESFSGWLERICQEIDCNYTFNILQPVDANAKINPSFPFHARTSFKDSWSSRMTCWASLVVTVSTCANDLTTPRLQRFLKKRGWTASKKKVHPACLNSAGKGFAIWHQGLGEEILTHVSLAALFWREDLRRNERLQIKQLLGCCKLFQHGSCYCQATWHRTRLQSGLQVAKLLQDSKSSNPNNTRRIDCAESCHIHGPLPHIGETTTAQPTKELIRTASKSWGGAHMGPSSPKHDQSLIHISRWSTSFMEFCSSIVCSWLSLSVHVSPTWDAAADDDPTTPTLQAWSP